MRTVVSIILFLSIQVSVSQILSEKERAILKDELLEDRFQNLLPQLMDDANLDMWLLISREYNEDPVLKTMLPARWLNARRRTIILFYRNKKQNTIESWNHLFENIYQESNDYEKISKRMSGYIKDNLDKSVFDLNLKKIILDILDQN